MVICIYCYKNATKSTFKGYNDRQSDSYIYLNSKVVYI